MKFGAEIPRVPAQLGAHYTLCPHSLALILMVLGFVYLIWFIFLNRDLSLVIAS